MENNNNNYITWEESMSRYNQLADALNDLIRHTTHLAQSYEDTNMEFAQLIYDKGLYQLMDEAKVLRTYEDGFKLMYYSLKSQVKQLDHLKEVMQLLLIKDPVNIPVN